jgi:uncharacterized membrane protein YdjX (TVP38/TMEM64 family)
VDVERAQDDLVRGSVGAPGPLEPVVRALGSPVVRLGVLSAMITAAIVLAARGGFSVDAIRTIVEGLGVLGPVAFVALYAVAVVLLLPASPFTIAAGVLFGPAVGVATAWTGAMLGALGAFLVGRAVGRRAVVQLGGQRVVAVDRRLTERGFAAVLIVRLVPLFPFNLINLVAGISGLTVRDYVLGTAIGIAPGTAVFAALGGTVADPTSPAFLGSLAAFVVLTVAAALASRRLRPSA